MSNLLLPILKGVTVGATTNITININGTNYSFIAF